jgi:hypothetical protein
MGLLKRIWNAFPCGGADAVAEDYARAGLYQNDNVSERSLSVAYGACPCTCASRDDLRVTIAAYLAAERKASNQSSKQ